VILRLYDSASVGVRASTARESIQSSDSRIQILAYALLLLFSPVLLFSRFFTFFFLLLLVSRGMDGWT